MNLPGTLNQFPRGDITNYHELGGLKHRSLFTHISGGQKSEIKPLTKWIPSGDSEGGFLLFSPSS